MGIKRSIVAFLAISTFFTFIISPIRGAVSPEVGGFLTMLELAAIGLGVVWVRMGIKTNKRDDK